MLENDKYDNTLLTYLEKKMADNAYKICQNRLTTLNLINHHPHNQETFKIKIKLNGTESKINFQENNPEILMAQEFAKYREKDKLSGRTNFGPHKTDVDFLNHDHISFELCSSGQQKMIFLYLIEIYARIIKENKGKAPILLLDEMISFLDQKNLAKVINSIIMNSSQVWMTSAEVVDFLDDSLVQRIQLN